MTIGLAITGVEMIRIKLKLNNFSLIRDSILSSLGIELCFLAVGYYTAVFRFCGGLIFFEEMP